ncbi:Clp protease N-terminal domain-containing protein [Actinophytocola sp.]|uniref:Clp protease N-terminal domain-containing protein n=1 Tax=Actinophytocola sp. TaxID=1872138 RepID=UPI00389B08B9
MTYRVHRVIAAAHRLARELGSTVIGDEHLFLGLLAESDGPAAAVLAALRVDPAQAGARTHDVIRERQAYSGAGAAPVEASMRLTTRATLVFDRSRTEAELLGSDHVGIEHLLLGMVRRDDTVAAMVLADLGADAARIREQVAALLTSTAPADQPKPPPRFPLPTRDPAHGNDSS